MVKEPFHKEGLFSYERDAIALAPLLIAKNIQIVFNRESKITSHRMQMETTAMVFENIPGSISVPDSIMPETLSVPDILLPQQYYDLLHKKHDLPEDLKLRLALLEDAISCFQNGIAKSGEEGMISAKKKELFEEAQRWIFSTMDEQDEPVFLLFSPVCESLNLNPNYIRKGLRAWEIKK